MGNDVKRQTSQCSGSELVSYISRRVSQSSLDSPSGQFVWSGGPETKGLPWSQTYPVTPRPKDSLDFWRHIVLWMLYHLNVIVGRQVIVFQAPHDTHAQNKTKVIRISLVMEAKYYSTVVLYYSTIVLYSSQLYIYLEWCCPCCHFLLKAFDFPLSRVHGEQRPTLTWETASVPTTSRQPPSGVLVERSYLGERSSLEP